MYIESINSNKEQLLSELCKETKCDDLCNQETHRNEEINTPKIDEMKLVALKPHRQYERAIFVRNSLEINSAKFIEENDIQL